MLVKLTPFGAPDRRVTGVSAHVGLGQSDFVSIVPKSFKSRPLMTSNTNGAAGRLLHCKYVLD